MNKDKSVIMRLLPFLAFVGIAVSFGFALKTAEPSKIPSTLIGRVVPQSEFPPIEGLASESSGSVPGFTSADLAKGKVTIVNFWASWCAQCVEEHPLLDKLAATSGAELYGVNYKDTTVAARRYLGRYGNPYEAIGTDTNGRTAIDWGVYGMPETFVIDGKGMIVYKHVGPLSEDAVAAKVMPAIEKAKSAAVASQPAAP
jgi:cytochrome c biogenesis protein CcmG, thiol:disulfide interchange protein DsbE